MASVVTQTQWHGNPRARKIYAITEFEALVATPQGGEAATYNYFNSLVPYAEVGLAASATTDTAGPAGIVEVSLNNLFKEGDAINYTFTGDVASAPADTYTVMKVGGMTPTEVLVDIVGLYNAISGTNSIASSDGNVMSVAALSPNTTLTVTTWAVTLA